MLDWRNIKIGRNDRAVLIGATGSGKTVLAQYLVEDNEKRNSVVYNNKPSDRILETWTKTQRNIENFQELETAEEERLIYTPPLKETLSQDLQDEFFGWIYERRYTRLYIDEATSLRGGVNPSYYLQACLCRGRERGISTIVATQRPARVPLIITSEAEHFYIFRLNKLGDRQRVYDDTGISVDEQTDLERFEFIYYNALYGWRSNRLKINPQSVSLLHSET